MKKRIDFSRYSFLVFDNLLKSTSTGERDLTGQEPRRMTWQSVSLLGIENCAMPAPLYKASLRRESLPLERGEGLLWAGNT